MSRTWFVLLSAAVVAAAFAVGMGLGLSGGPRGGAATRTTSTSPTGAASGASPIALPTSLYTACRPRPVAVGTGATCASPLAGVDEVLVVKWPDAATMQADWSRTKADKPDGKCGSFTGTPATGLSSTWGDGRPLACYVNSAGAAVVMWEVPDRALQLLAVRKDGDTRAAFGWWTQAIATPL